MTHPQTEAKGADAKAAASLRAGEEYDPLVAIVKLDRPIYVLGKSTIEADGIFADRDEP